MLKKNLKKIKWFFTISIFIWMLLLVLSTKNRVLERQVGYIQREAKSLRYEFELKKELGVYNLASVGSLLSQPFGRFEQSEANAAASPERAIPVLLYHGIVSNPDRFSLTPETFKNQMFALKKAGYQTVRLADVLDFIHGTKSLPEKSFLLTFDDGRVDSYEEADPILKALGWSSVMFVATAQSFPTTGINEYYINEEQIKNMSESGRWEIESHAVQLTGGSIPISDQNTGNLLSNKMWLPSEQHIENDEEYNTRIEREFGESKGLLERTIGHRVNFFAYPFGDYGQESRNATGSAELVVRHALENAGYTAAFQQTWAKDNFFTFNYPESEDMYRLRRIEPESTWNGDDLLNYLTKATPKNIPYVDELNNDRGWKNPWGNISFDELGMHLFTNEQTTGSFAFLDGTRDWREYMYAVNALKEKGGYISLFARYQNDDNYVSCTFGDKLIKIDEKVNGTLHTLIEDKNPITLPQEATLGMYVSDRLVNCYEGNGRAIISSTMDESLASGGIGLRIWDETINNGAVTFSSLRVVPDDEAESFRKSLPSYESLSR